MNNIYILLLYLIAFTTQFAFLRDIIFSENLLSSLISVLAIFFGFYIVSLSIFSMSNFLGNLYEVEIKDKRGYKTTNLHVLLNYYKFGFLLNLISIFYFLFLKGCDANGSVFVYLGVPLVVHNFVYAYISLNRLLKIIIQEVKK